MGTIRQLFSFGTIGAISTLAHVGTALLLMKAGNIDGYLANAFGACIALGLSFLGNANFTFNSDRALRSSARRYVVISFISFVITSLIMAITKHIGLSALAYAAIVIVTVPPTTFMLAKLWAFSPVKKRVKANPS